MSETMRILVVEDDRKIVSFVVWVLGIDGCKEECARKTMELAGFKNFQHRKLAELGSRKGESRVTAAWIREVAAKGVELPAC